MFFLPALFRVLELPQLDEFREHAPVSACEIHDHIPIGFCKILSFLTVRGNALFLKAYRLVLKPQESVHKRLSAFFIKTVADMVKSLVVKMFDEPVKIIFHLQIDDNISVFFEVDRLHLKDFPAQHFQFPQRFGQAVYLLPDSGRLFRQNGRDLCRCIKGGQPVFYIVQRKTQMFEGQNLMQFNDVFICI